MEAVAPPIAAEKEVVEEPPADAAPAARRRQKLAAAAVAVCCAAPEAEALAAAATFSWTFQGLKPTRSTARSAASWRHIGCARECPRFEVDLPRGPRRSDFGHLVCVPANRG